MTADRPRPGARPSFDPELQAESKPRAAASPDAHAQHRAAPEPQPAASPHPNTQHHAAPKPQPAPSPHPNTQHHAAPEPQPAASPGANAELRGDELIARRELAAGPERVWEAFTSAGGISAFWGGSHAIVPVGSVVVDLRVGGEFALDTRAPGGGAGRRLRFVYVSIDPPRELVFDEPVTGLRTTVTLRAAGDGTHLTVHQRRLPPELRTAQAADGLASILDALATHLSRSSQ